MDVPRAKRPRLDQRLCPHCDQVLSCKTYRGHKRLHFNAETNEWFKVDEVHVETIESSDTCSHENDSSDSEPEGMQHAPLDEIRVESPPLSEPALSSISDDNQSDSDTFQCDSEYHQSSGQFGLIS